MCGITGFVGFDDKLILKKMTKCLAHRGPDEESFYTSKQCSLGHRRLVTIDPTKGIYPVHNENEDVFLVFNGDIYNYQQLNTDLEKKGHKFYSNCDAETIVHAYEEYGLKCFEKFNGMFAIAIWDTRKKQLILARDSVGIKPLHYAIVGKKILFASEIKALLTSDMIKKQIDEQALSNYLFFQYILEPRTIFSQIKKLEPGHYMVFDKAAKIHGFSRMNLDVKENSEKYFIDRLDKEISTAVDLEKVADVPLGCFLSGGVDSSTVTATLSKLTDKLDTFSIGFEEKRFDESKYARIVSEKFNTEHHEKMLTPDDLVKAWPKVVDEFDEPFADSSAIPTYLVSKLARKYVTISLSGDGGDELFCGYTRYFYANSTKNLSFLGKFLKPVYPVLPNKFKTFVDYSQKHNLEGYAEFVNVIKEPENYLKKNTKPELQEKYWLNHLRYFKRMQYYDLKTYLPGDILTKVDRCTMANSLVSRVPLLNLPIVNLAFSVPSRYTANAFDQKMLLKKVALKKGVPRNVLYRKKQGFAVPINEWMLKDLKSEVEEIILEKDNYLKPSSVENLWKHYLSTKRNSHAVWAVLMFKLWKKKYINNEKVKF